MGEREMERFAARIAHHHKHGGYDLHVVYFMKLPATHTENVKECVRDSDETMQIGKIREEGIKGLNHFVSALTKVHKLKNVTQELVECKTTPKAALAHYLKVRILFCGCFTCLCLLCHYCDMFSYTR